jgi:hypothetical protein
VGIATIALGALGALAVLGGVLLACRQLVGIGDSPPTGAGGEEAGGGGGDAGADAPVCGIAYAGASCEACLESNCCAQATACSGSQPCAAFERCAGGCDGDVTCGAQCVQDHRYGKDPTIPAFHACLVTNCGATCGYACGGVALAATPDAAVSCQQCYLANGCDVAQKCLGDPGCASYAICTAAATTFDVSEACANLIGADSGVDAATYSALANNTCNHECAFDSNWSCVGHVAWQPPTIGDVTIQLRLNDPFQSSPPAGVTARVCGDVLCSTSPASDTSDGGVVTLVQHADAGPLVTRGYIELADGGIVPQLFYWTFPLSEPSVSMGATVVTQPQLESVAAVSGFTQDWSRAFVYVIGYDCLLSQGAGMTFSLSPPVSQPCYGTGSAFVCGDGGAGSGTSAVFPNVPVDAGALTLVAYAPGVGPIGQFPVLVRPGTGTQVLALPQQQ